MSIEKGKLVRWIDEKGFGFIKPENGKNDIFIHISALKNMSRNPVIGDLILYEINVDSTGKQRAVNALIEGVSQNVNIAPIEKTIKSAPPRKKNESSRKNYNAKTQTKSLRSLYLVIILGLGIFIYEKFLTNKNVIDPKKISETVAKSVDYNQQFKCEGKVYCTQMSTYDEAFFYLNNCPGTKMDGDGDGIPCEQQF
jgi:cold shock CspA family protein